jgi:Mg2+/Co2+ transporter CorB
MTHTNEQYLNLVDKVSNSLLHSMKESSLIRIEDWKDDARDIISMLREKSIRNEEMAKNMIEEFYVNKESHDNFTDFETPAEAVAKIYLQNEYL